MSKGPPRAEIVPVKELRVEVTDQLYHLYAQCYEGSNGQRFNADLQEKDWVILLRDSSTGTPAGFSTQMMMRVAVNQRTVYALFSGDTIIHPSYWGSQELVRAWCRFAGQLKANLQHEAFFWFLISKGYRTYLYLPCFFQAFYPRWDIPTPPFETELIRVLGRTKYPDKFNPSTGLVEHDGMHDRLKMELDTTEKRLHNPHVAYFFKRDPDYWKGSELVCVAEIALNNMRSIALQELMIGLSSMETAQASSL